jgi:hypothetical protein
VYAPRLYQGIGFKLLYDLQGCDATRLLLQEINNKGSTPETWITNHPTMPTHTQCLQASILTHKNKGSTTIYDKHDHRYLVEDMDMEQILLHPTHISIASDGGHNPNTGISTYGWVVAMNKVPVAMGRGPAAAHPSVAESFRAEGYGLAAAAKFLNGIIAKYKVDTANHVWHFFIYNKAIIQRMESYQQNSLGSKCNLRPDADITNLAADRLRHIPASLIHDKSHQDEHKEWDKLLFEAQLNIMADAQATRQHQLMEEPWINSVPGFYTLHLENRPITRDSQKWLLQKAAEIPIQDYFQEKLGWKSKTFHSINWKCNTRH